MYKEMSRPSVRVQEEGSLGVKPEERMSQRHGGSCFMGLFCANETLLNLTTDRGDLSLELEQFSSQRSRPLQPCNPHCRTALLLLVPGPVNCQYQVRNLPRINTSPSVMHGFRKVELLTLRAAGLESELLPYPFLRFLGCSCPENRGGVAVRQWFGNMLCSVAM